MSQPLRIIVTGGRSYADRAEVFRVLDEVDRWARRPLVIVHGACGAEYRAGQWDYSTMTGADRWADEWAAENGYQVERHPADWGAHGYSAGPIRNREMALLGARWVVAFPGGRGTRNCLIECRKRRIAAWQGPDRV